MCAPRKPRAAACAPGSTSPLRRGRGPGCWGGGERGAGYGSESVGGRAGVRPAQASRSGLRAGLDIAFKAGAVTGLLVVGLGILGAGIYYFILRAWFPPEELRRVLEAMAALGFGASLISTFARLGGGIFTKGA